MMRNLPVPVNEDDIDAMFDFADKDKDGKINYRYYQVSQKSVRLCTDLASCKRTLFLGHPVCRFYKNTLYYLLSEKCLFEKNYI